MSIGRTSFEKKYLGYSGQGSHGQRVWSAWVCMVGASSLKLFESMKI